MMYDIHRKLLYIVGIDTVKQASTKSKVHAQRSFACHFKGVIGLK